MACKTTTKLEMSVEPGEERESLINLYKEVKPLLGAKVRQVRIRHQDGRFTNEIKRLTPELMVECYDQREYTNFDPDFYGEIKLNGEKQKLLFQIGARRDDESVKFSAVVPEGPDSVELLSYLERKGFSTR